MFHASFNGNRSDTPIRSDIIVLEQTDRMIYYIYIYIYIYTERGGGQIDREARIIHRLVPFLSLNIQNA